MGVARCLRARYAHFLEIRSSFDLDVCLVISDPFCHGKSLFDHHLGRMYMFHVFQSNYANLTYNMLNCQLMNTSNCFLSHGLFGATSLNLLTPIPEIHPCYFVGGMAKIYITKPKLVGGFKDSLFSPLPGELGR